MSVSEQGGFEFDASKRPIAADHVAASGFGRFPWKPAFASIKKRYTRDFTIAPVERSSAGTLPLLQKTKMCRPVPPNFLQNFPALRAGISPETE